MKAIEDGAVSGWHGLKIEPPSDRGKYVELKCLEAQYKVSERMRKWLENRGKTLTILEKSQITLGSGKEIIKHSSLHSD